MSRVSLKEFEDTLQKGKRSLGGRFPKGIDLRLYARFKSCRASETATRTISEDTGINGSEKEEVQRGRRHKKNWELGWFGKDRVPEQGSTPMNDGKGGVLEV